MEPLVVISSDKKRRVRRTSAVGVMLKVSFVLLDTPAIVKLAIKIWFGLPFIENTSRGCTSRMTKSLIYVRTHIKLSIPGISCAIRREAKTVASSSQKSSPSCRVKHIVS